MGTSVSEQWILWPRCKECGQGSTRRGVVAQNSCCSECGADRLKLESVAAKPIWRTSFFGPPKICGFVWRDQEKKEDEFSRLPQKQRDWLGSLNYCELHEGLGIISEKIAQIDARLDEIERDQVAEVGERNG